MSDYNSSLPVRTENAGDLVVKIGDGTTPSQQASVDASGRMLTRITDTGGTTLNSTSNALNVFVTNSTSGAVADKTAFTYGTTVDTIIGGVFQDTSPTLTAGQSGATRLTANRAFHVNLRDAAGNEKLGSSLSAASIPVVIASDQGAVTVTGTVAATQSGTWTVQIGNTPNTTAILVKDSADGSVSGGTAGTFSMLGGLQFNTAAPTLTTGQQAALQGDASANLLVKVNAALPTGSNTIGAVTQASGPWTITGTGTAGTPAAGVVTIQGISGGTAIPISGTVTATNPSVGSTGSAIPTSATLLGASDGTNLQQLLVESSTNRNLRIGIYNGANEAAVKAASTAAVATDPALVVAISPNNTIITSDLADGSVGAGTAGTKSMLGGLVFNTAAPSLTNGQQVALQGDSSGNLLVNLKTALPTGSNTIGAVTQSGTWTVAQGTPNSAANAWPTKITDGTNTAAVKAASTAAVAGDPSLVVALSPNSPLPAGTANIGNVGILVGGTANGPTNPLYVTTESQAGTAVNAYNTSAAVAAAATATFDYTVTAAKTFYGTQLWVSGSGKIKVQISFETAALSGTFVVFWTGFNSTADTNILIPLADKTQVTGAKIRVVITNRDQQAQDVYSTLSGTEV